MITKDPKQILPAKDEITYQLEHMLASPNFTATPQQVAFLKYVVSQTLTGNADRVKGYTVATKVFGRRKDFDQSIDPIVSIQASRLRQALARYYETAGKNDPILIDIPKGGYVPTFAKQLTGDQPIAAEHAAPVSAMTTWPTVLVRPLTKLTDNPEDNNLVIGMTAELAHALGHYREIRVFEALHRDQKSPPTQADIDYIIDGNVRRDSEGILVAIRLRDAKKGIQIWSGKYHGGLDATKMISFQEEVAGEIAVCLAGDDAVISRHLPVKVKIR